jgi:hypothetical protein
MRYAIAFLCVLMTVVGLSGCSANPAPLSGEALKEAVACRGANSAKAPERQVRSLDGKVVTGDGGPVPGLRVVATEMSPPGRVYVVSTDASGKFSFGGIPFGPYMLKTCLVGFDTLEMPVTTSPTAAPDRLVLEVKLGS